MVASVPIIVIGYNRPKALERLLNSLLKATYSGKVDLIISIDGETGRRGEEVREVAEKFAWPHGEKKLIFHETNLGLRNHVLSCGDLSQEYDGVIVLEDDLYVSPVFYHYTLQAYDFYKDDPKIAGISLYSHAYNETAQFPFRPLTDDSDVFFLQYAASLGQFWSRKHWAAFREWYNIQSPGDKSPVNSIPPNIRMWPETSWKKYFISYIIQHSLYFVYPRYSLTTNFGDQGTNLRISENLFQVPLWLEKQKFQFNTFTESNSVYDIYCEIEAGRLKKLAPSLAKYDFEVDLYGMKSGEDSRKDLFLSSRKCSKPFMSFGREMKPQEMNIVADIPGDYFSLGGKGDFQEQNYFLRLLKCHEKRELAYWYSIREYHFYKNRLLTTEKVSKPWFDPGFMLRKIGTMANYTFRYLRK
jgi:glycosyltransferase involved in cell wall biosynthesis